MKDALIALLVAGGTFGGFYVYQQLSRPAPPNLSLIPQGAGVQNNGVPPPNPFGNGPPPPAPPKV